MCAAHCCSYGCLINSNGSPQVVFIAGQPVGDDQVLALVVHALKVPPPSACPGFLPDLLSHPQLDWATIFMGPGNDSQEPRFGADDPQLPQELNFRALPRYA